MKNKVSKNRTKKNIKLNNFLNYKLNNFEESLLSLSRVNKIYNKKPKCTICGKSFVNTIVLNKHINAIHKNISPYQCLYPECGKSFRTGYRLYVHELSHKGIKPFSCSICTYIYYLND